jgi:hypothetical protein
VAAPACREGGVSRLRSVPAPAWAALALVAALLLALLARDVRGWERSVGYGDERFQVAPGPNGLWEPHGARPLGGVARLLLGLDDDLDLRRAAQLERRSRPRDGSFRTTPQLATSTSAQVAFAGVQGSDAPAEVRSIAANEIGVLTLADVLADSSQASELSPRAVRKFTEASTLDPENPVAQANLELVLTLLQTDDPRVDPEAPARGSGSGAGAGATSGKRGF